MIKEIKRLRVKIDGIGQLISSIPDYNSSELSKCYDSIMLSKAWLGKVLGELSENTPYTNDGKRKTVEDIEDVADVWVTKKNSFIRIDLLLETRIQRIDYLRQELKKLSEDSMYEVFNLDPKDVLKRHCFMIESYMHLINARIWLGFELGRIKEKTKNN